MNVLEQHSIFAAEADHLQVQRLLTLPASRLGSSEQYAKAVPNQSLTGPVRQIFGRPYKFFEICDGVS